MPCTPISSSRVYVWCYFSLSPSSLSSRCAFYSTEFGQGGRPDTLVLLCLRVCYHTLNFLIITEYLKNQNKNAHSHADWALCALSASSFNHRADIEECISPASTRGATICTIRFCFGVARVLEHSLWYADKLVIVAQLNGCASSTSQAYAPMR